MAVSGVRSSWLTIARNSDFSSSSRRSSSLICASERASRSFSANSCSYSRTMVALSMKIP